MEKPAGLPSMPYFDMIFDEMEHKNPHVIETFGHHAHWGYWDNPKNADLSATATAKAMDALIEQLIAWYKVQDGHSILDVGCGFGGTLSLLDKKLNGAFLTGVNIDPRQLTRARKIKFTKNKIEFIEANACDLPFGKDQFDTVLAVECIFHFPSRKKFFKEVFRVLKPGGRFVLSDFVSRNLTLPLLGLTYLWNARDLNATYGKGYAIRSGTYQKLAKQSGLKFVGSKDITRNTLPTYPFLYEYFKLMNVSKGYTKATRWFEFVSQRGWLNYEVVAFEK